MAVCVWLCELLLIAALLLLLLLLLVRRAAAGSSAADTPATDCCCWMLLAQDTADIATNSNTDAGAGTDGAAYERSPVLEATAVVAKRTHKTVNPRTDRSRRRRIT